MDKSEKQYILIGVLFIIILLVALCFTAAWYHTIDSFEATVNGKERHEGGYYLIYTDKGVLRISNWWGEDGFNSSDTYSNLVEGQTYDFTTYGYRIGILSQYPMIDTYNGEH